MDTLIRNMTGEYVEAKGFVTCEFSASLTALVRLQDDLETANKIMADAKCDGKWVAFECSTCAEHDPETPIHVSIERKDAGVDSLID